MGTKKSLCFSLALFVITVWIWGFATPGLSETLKCKGESKQVVQAYDSVLEDDFYIGVNTREGMATCENGETATVKSFSAWDVIWQKEGFSQMYTISVVSQR